MLGKSCDGLASYPGGGTLVQYSDKFLCMALLNFLLFCFVFYCYAFVQYCYLKSIQYNAMHRFVRVLDNPRGWGLEVGGGVGGVSSNAPSSFILQKPG